MDKEIIELLNNILKIAYEFGWKVGASWNIEQYKKLVDPSGYLNDDAEIDKALKENITNLLIKFNYNTKDLVIYTKEDNSYHSSDWDYIAPVIDFKE